MEASKKKRNQKDTSKPDTSNNDPTNMELKKVKMFIKIKIF